MNKPKPIMLIICLLLAINSAGCWGSSADAAPTLPADLPQATEVPTEAPAAPSPSLAEPDPPSATTLPTAKPITDADYQGWWLYTQAEYGFSLRLPADWEVETTSDSALLDGHLLQIHPKDEGSRLMIRMTFRSQGDQTLIWPTGVGQGTFVENGSLEISGEAAKRNTLVCPTGEVDSIWYMGYETPHLTRSGLEFGFIFENAIDHCEEGYSLMGKEQYIGEMIIASLEIQE